MVIDNDYSKKLLILWKSDFYLVLTLHQLVKNPHLQQLKLPNTCLIFLILALKIQPITYLTLPYAHDSLLDCFLNPINLANDLLLNY
ncbi:hypothetical protein SDC9_211155 [bioreactor metagenome]|uniref:Uncharacterized protein n=1 Tax=bioreactor metagenome TaxID=1076179 RepID=A0A645JJ71_9ZZZZ